MSGDEAQLGTVGGDKAGMSSSSHRPAGSASQLLPQLLAASQLAQETAARGRCLVATVVDDHHPTLLGRARVRFVRGEETFEVWLPTLMHVPVREGDRVLVLCPENSSESVVVGVLDGYAKRPASQERVAASLEVRRDECVRIVDSRGTPLLEVKEGPDGAELRLFPQDAHVALEGALSLEADSLRFAARSGNVQIDANDDVVVRGEVVRLN